METAPVRDEEEQQFRDYVAGQSARLRRTAYLLCGDWHASQDLVQETSCRLFVVWPRVSKMDQIHLYARKTPLRAYLQTQLPGRQHYRTMAGWQVSYLTDCVDGAHLDTTEAIFRVTEHAGDLQVVLGRDTPRQPLPRPCTATDSAAVADKNAPGPRRARAGGCAGKPSRRRWIARARPQAGRGLACAGMYCWVVCSSGGSDQDVVAGERHTA